MKKSNYKIDMLHIFDILHMAISIPLSNINDEIIEKIKTKCVIFPDVSTYNDDPKPVFFFTTETREGKVYAPLGVWKDFYSEFPHRKLPSTNISFKKKLYSKDTDPKKFRDQDRVAAEAHETLLKERTVFLALCTGFGKTTLGNYFTCLLKQKTAVVTFNTEVKKQWVEEFEKFSTAKVQLVEGSVLDPTADVYIIGVHKATKFSREDFSQIGLVIYDEAHIATVTAFSSAFLNFLPNYFIALSATPDARSDGMSKIFDMYFGSNFIVRHEFKNFTVYKVVTPYKPEIRYSVVKGKTVPDWCHIVNTISENTERHKLIVSLVEKNPQHKILILSDRQSQSIAIYESLKNLGENVSIRIGNSKKCTDDYRILVAGMKKLGAGFNDPTLTMLILVNDTTRVVQFEGRIRTVNNVIYDLVDNFPSFENHWKMREEWYSYKGAKIVEMNLRGERSTKIPTRKLKANTHTTERS